jgi:CelD/BcsL family acetyltransferase involved in cellulose biosynthesis
VTLALAEGLPQDDVAWSVLAEASTNVFLTPEWTRTWWDRFGGGRRLVTISDRGALFVLCGSTAGPVRTLRFAGHGLADELGPVCGDAERRSAAASLTCFLREHDVCDVLLGEQLPAALDWAGRAGGQTIDRISSPALRFEHTSWDELFASRSSKLRAQVRRDERVVRAAGPVSLRLSGDADRLDTDLDALFAMHRERWGTRSGFLSGGSEDFHRCFARLALERGWLRLWLLEVRGRPEAAWYGFRFGNCDAHYQSGRFSTCPRGGGTVLLAHAIRSALEDGLGEYRFLRGGEEYKLRWANADRALETVAVGVSRSGRAIAGLAGLAAGRRGRVIGRATRRALLRPAVAG